MTTSTLSKAKTTDRKTPPCTPKADTPTAEDDPIEPFKPAYPEAFLDDLRTTASQALGDWLRRNAPSEVLELHLCVDGLWSILANGIKNESDNNEARENVESGLQAMVMLGDWNLYDAYKLRGGVNRDK